MTSHDRSKAASRGEGRTIAKLAWTAPEMTLLSAGDAENSAQPAAGDAVFSKGS